MKTVSVDIAIFGGGIAGLWLLNRLARTNLSCSLFETDRLGGGQTMLSQGIIHGGTKYALGGEQTAATKAIASMPALWANCLKGEGEINLSHVPVLSQHQYLFATNKLLGKLAGFFGKIALQGILTQLDRDQYPEVFQHPNFNGVVYALNEMAIDVYQLLKALSERHNNIYKIDTPDDSDFHFEQQYLKEVVLKSGDERILLKAQKIIFTAGAGNEFLLKANLPITKMQRRPLRMVIAKTNFDMPVFAHALGASALPRITITTHKCADGKYAWYLGGQIAEEGIALSNEEQIKKAQQELSTLFPWVTFDKSSFKSFMIDRAEPLQEKGKRPDNCFFQQVNNLLVAWPTKLALAPNLANELLQALSSVQPKLEDVAALEKFARPDIATPIWDRL